MFNKHHDSLDNKNKQEIETVIGSSINVKGNFIGKGNIRIEGKINGSVRTRKDIVVSNGSVVEANIYGENILIAGNVKGNVRAQGKLTLSKTAQVKGDVEYLILSVEEGAILNGKCTLGTPEDKNKIPEKINPKPITVKDDKNKK